MSDKLIEGHFQETNNGPYYNVKLNVIPRVGDEIEFYSELDFKSGHPANKIYIVEKVSHKISDASDTYNNYFKNGSQFVTVFVKKVSEY